MESVQHYIDAVFKKYKSSLSVEEQKVVTMYLYDQGEYEEALLNLLAILKNHDITLDKDANQWVISARGLMKI